jgi:hypothetical protein
MAICSLRLQPTLPIQLRKTKARNKRKTEKHMMLLLGFFILDGGGNPSELTFYPSLLALYPSLYAFYPSLLTLYPPLFAFYPLLALIFHSTHSIQQPSFY